MRISENRLRSVIRQVINEEDRITRPMSKQDYQDNDLEPMEKDEKKAEMKRRELSACSKSHYKRSDGRRVFMCDGEMYDYDTMLPTWYFDGKSLGKRFNELGSKLKSFFTS